MTVTYGPFRGVTVSREWAAILDAAAKAGVEFQLNSGHRTMQEQQDLVNRKGVWSPSNQQGAARPSPTAPHIRVGRCNHAIDVDTAGNGVVELIDWLRSKRVTAVRNVPGEPWHVFVASEQELRRLAAELDDPLKEYTESERRWIREYDRLTRAQADPERRRVLRRTMLRQRKRVWRVAQPRTRGGDGRGWDHANRSGRYRSLLSRTHD